MRKFALLLIFAFVCLRATSQITFITPTDSLTVKHIYFGIDSVQAIISSPNQSSYLLINPSNNTEFIKIGIQTYYTKTQRSIVLNLTPSNYATLSDTIINVRFEAQDTNKTYVYRIVKLIIHNSYRSGLKQAPNEISSLVYVTSEGRLAGMENTNADEALIYSNEGKCVGIWKRSDENNKKFILSKGIYSIVFKLEDVIIGVKKIWVP